MTENHHFLFRLSPYPAEALLPQVSRALEQRTERQSREQYPALWKSIDRLRKLGRNRPVRRHKKLRSAVYLALGIFLFVPGLMKPRELMIPLIVGTVAILFGVCGLWKKRNRFDAAARQLLTMYDGISEELSVSFSAEEMTIPTTDQGDIKTVPYSQLECILETDDIFLLIYDTLVTVLQKCDLTGGSPEDFRAFVSEKISRYQRIS